MIRLKDLANPKRVYKDSGIYLRGEAFINEVDYEIIKSETNKYINVRDENGDIIGSINRERLNFIISNYDPVFSQMMDSLDVGVVAIDKNSRIFYVNPAYSKILEVDIAKVLGRYMEKIEPEASILQVLKDGKYRFVENQHIKSIDKFVSTKVNPILKCNKIWGAFSTFTDVTKVNRLNFEVKRISQVAEEFNRRIEANEIKENNRLIGSSKAFNECIEKAIKVANTDAVVLIRGENGCGKEVIANLIREIGLRKDKPFIALNCSAIPEALIESELFGYEGGSFTGADKKGRLGKFQLADGGTLFLDEIGDMPYNMQSRLLRVLQGGEIEKIGRDANIPVDVRVIAATNKPLEEMVKSKNFRQDLYYRLKVVTIDVPPLRLRENDVILLADYFLEKYNSKYKRHLKFSKDVYRKFLQYSWPGNVRELKNVIEGAVVLCDKDEIDIYDLGDEIVSELELSDVEIYENCFKDEKSFKEQVECFERNLILNTLRKNRGDIKKTISQLNLSRRTYYRKISNKTH